DWFSAELRACRARRENFSIRVAGIGLQLSVIAPPRQAADMIDVARAIEAAWRIRLQELAAEKGISGQALAGSAPLLKPIPLRESIGVQAYDPVAFRHRRNAEVVAFRKTQVFGRSQDLHAGTALD